MPRKEQPEPYPARVVSAFRRAWRAARIRFLNVLQIRRSAFKRSCGTQAGLK